MGADIRLQDAAADFKHADKIGLIDDAQHEFKGKIEEIAIEAGANMVFAEFLYDFITHSGDWDEDRHLGPDQIISAIAFVVDHFKLDVHDENCLDFLIKLERALIAEYVRLGGKLTEELQQAGVEGQSLSLEVV